MGRVHFGSAAHFFVIPGPRPALDKLDPESSAFGQSQATRTPVPGLQWGRYHRSDGFSQSHQTKRGLKKNVDKDIYINIISYNLM
jgi:hypothetical protein